MIKLNITKLYQPVTAVLVFQKLQASPGHQCLVHCEIKRIVQLTEKPNHIEDKRVSLKIMENLKINNLFYPNPSLFS